MQKLKTIAKGLAAPVLAIALPLVAGAQFQQPPVTAPNSPISNVSSLTGTGGLFCTIVNWLFYLLIIAAIIFVLVAAFRYLTAGGDPEKVKAAGNTLLYAAIAVVVALIAKGLPYIVTTFFGSTVINAC